jgi:hypothetical protein
VKRGVYACLEQEIRRTGETLGRRVEAVGHVVIATAAKDSTTNLEFVLISCPPVQ